MCSAANTWRESKSAVVLRRVGMLPVCPLGILVCGILCGSTPSIVGKCRGKGVIARLTPVIVGSR